jgi:C1A family cysteine protease
MAGQDNRRPEFSLPAVREALSAAGHPWTAANNAITQLSPDDRAIRLGVPVPADEEIENHLQSAKTTRQIHLSAAAAAAGLPASFDARNVGGVNYVTPVKDQGNCGSCVAFGSIAVMETTAAFTRRVPSMQLDLSEAHLFYTHGGSVGRNCGNGWWPVPALTFCKDAGVTFEDYFPYTPGNSGGAVLNPDWSNRLGSAIDVREVTGDPATIKEQIVQYGAVTACFYVYDDFFGYRSGVYRHVSGKIAGGHCVALVGYDDAQGCWIAKNSWGPGWGDNGYFKIAYGECAIETWQCAGVTGVTLRAWTGLSKVIGLWSNEAARNAWAYLETTGWLRLSNDSDIAANEMVAEVVAAKGAGRQVNAYADNGAVSEIYVY